MNDDVEFSLEGMIGALSDEQQQQKEDLIAELHRHKDPHDALNVVTFALTDFLSQIAPNKESAMGAAAWMMVCITMTLEKWDEQKLCNWNETRQ